LIRTNKAIKGTKAHLHLNEDTMANNKVFEELKAALQSAQPQQLSSHSTLKAAEALLACLRCVSAAQ
jgi:hypothetical protein